MDTRNLARWIGLVILGWLATVYQDAIAAPPYRVILPEQRRIQVRGVGQLPSIPVLAVPRPATVSDPQLGKPQRPISLDEAINIALRNAEVVRVLGGITANTSGRTVYDVAITNAGIDSARAAFDPRLRTNNSWNRNETPSAVPDLIDPTQSVIVGSRTDNHLFDFGLSKRNELGGTADLSVNNSATRFPGIIAPLDTQNRSNVDLSYTQPLFQGAGRAANRAPIVLARIDTERSYFQYKDSVQRMVQGVIDGYWALVFAKTDLWAREQQLESTQFAYDRAKAEFEAERISGGQLAQAEVALENFRASLLASQANVLQRRVALLNLLGLPAYEAEVIVPVTPMVSQPVQVDWVRVNDLAIQQRPDIVELKLVLEADQQQLIQADNQAKPALDAVGLYRWDGLEGEVPAGNRIRSGAGEFTDWTLAVNFSVPLGLRRERALLRQQQLIIRRDRANLDQGVHQTQHLLALNLRNLDQFFAQYERFQDVRTAARKNLEQQLIEFAAGRENFIVVLQAIVDWGNAVSSEAQSLSQYNTELALLELNTGSILESHGITFYEERFCAIGPFGRMGKGRQYPASTKALDRVARYPEGDQPSEKYFNLEDPTGASGPEDDMDIDRKLELDADIDYSNRPKDDVPLSDEQIEGMLESNSPPDASMDLDRFRL